MQSRSLLSYITSLAPSGFTTITLDRPGPYNHPKVHQEPAVPLTSYPALSASSSSPAWVASSLPSSSVPPTLPLLDACQ